MKKLSRISFEFKKKDLLWGLGLVLFVAFVLFFSFANINSDVIDSSNIDFKENIEPIIVVDNVYDIGNGKIKVRTPKDGFSELVAYDISDEYKEVIFTNNRTNKSITERIINGEINSRIEAEENDVILFTIK